MRTKLKQAVRRWRGVLIAAPGVALVVVLLRLTGLLQILEWSLLDQYFRLRPLEPPDSRIVIVGINESDLKQYGWPISDAVLAEALEQLKQRQPRSIGLDIYRNLPVEPGHQTLVDLFKSTPNLIGITKVVGDQNASSVPPPPTLKELGQISANDAILDDDGKLRRGLLYLSDPDGNAVLGFAFKAALQYLEVEDIEVEVTDNGWLKIDHVTFVPFQANDGGYIRADAGGYQILVNFRGPASYFPMVSLQDVVEGKISEELIRDRVVLIGSTAESLKDQFYTPYQLTPGVEIHANLTSQILNSVLSNRNAIRTWPDPIEWVWILLWSTIGATLGWQQRYSRDASKQSDRNAPLSSSNAAQIQFIKTGLSILLAAGALVGSSYLIFLSGWWIPVIPPMLGLVGAASAINAYIAQTAAQIRRTFGRYLNDEVVASLLETPEGLKLGGEKREVTFLVSDLRGFSAISERLPPEQVVKLLNLYLERMIEVIDQYGGTLNEITGDGLFVFFGAPHQQEDDAQRAVACAVAMQLAMTSVNQRNRELDLPQLEMGIGINTGVVVVGNIGSQKHAKYTAIGSHINLTARIESCTVGGQILISESTREEVGSILTINGQMQATVKGFADGISLYEIGGIEGPYQLFLPIVRDALVALEAPIPLRYTLLEEKNLVGYSFPGKLIKLSVKGGEIQSEHPAVLLSNIKIDLSNDSLAGEPLGDLYAQAATPLGDLYAKVMEVSPQHLNCFYVRFTAIPPGVAGMLRDLVENDGKR